MQAMQRKTGEVVEVRRGRAGTCHAYAVIFPHRFATGLLQQPLTYHLSESEFNDDYVPLTYARRLLNFSRRVMGLPVPAPVAHSRLAG